MDKHPLREGLPELPPMMAHLPIDARGYPVPMFVHRAPDGTPDHRVARTEYLGQCVRHRLCWICGKPLALNFLAYVVGPVALVTRTSPEPPMHAQCATYACTACPFLTRPHAHRRDAGLPEDVRAAPGAIMQNPQAVLLWMAREYSIELEPGPSGRIHTVFNLGEPLALRWFCEGRPATADEGGAALEGSIARIQALAEADGPQALQELQQRLERAADTLDRLTGQRTG